MNVKKYLGLMFNFRSLATATLKVNERDKYIHTWFCRRMDISFYGEDLKLIKRFKAVKPFSIIMIPKGSKIVKEITLPN